MTDQPVTPDREALIEVADEALRRDCQSKPCMDAVHKTDAVRAVDALLPLLADALDRARQQGESAGIEKAAQAIGVAWDRMELSPTDYSAGKHDGMADAINLVRAADRKADDEGQQ